MLEFAEFQMFCAGIEGIGRGADWPPPRRDCGIPWPAVGAGDSAGDMSSGRGPGGIMPAMPIGERGICSPV